MTQDGGENWRLVGTFQGEPDFSFTDFEHAWMFANETDASQLYISTDGAETWQTTRPVIAQKSKSALTVTATPLAANINRLAQADKLMLRQIVRSDTKNGWLIAADPEGTEHILHSEDSGYSWKDSSPPEPLKSNPDYPQTVEGFFLNNNSAWVVYSLEPTSESNLLVWRL